VELCQESIRDFFPKQLQERKLAERVFIFIFMDKTIDKKEKKTAGVA